MSVPGRLAAFGFVSIVVAAGDARRCAALVWVGTVVVELHVTIQSQAKFNITLWMQPTWRQYADYFAMGLLLELCSVDEVIAWVDQIIEDSDRPAEWMIEISTSTSKHFLDIIHLLDLVPGKKDLETSLRLVIAKLGKVYPTLLPEQERFAQPKHNRLFSELYFLVQDHDNLSEAVRGNIYQMDFDLDYVQQGYGDWSIIQQDYKELLEAGNSYEQWIDF